MTARAAVREAARRLPADVEVFQHGEVGEDAAILRHEAEPSRAISNGSSREMSCAAEADGAAAPGNQAP